MEKILTTIKKQIGIDESITDFDDQVVLAINMAISVLTQIGIGPSNGFLVKTKNELWTEYIPDLETNPKYINVQTYIYCRSKLLVDPPSNQTQLAALKETASEMEYRLRIASETL